MQDAPIEVESLARRYGRRWALSDLSFTIPAGRVVMVAGRNGSGKSTLFRVLATAIRPDLGKARIAGFDVIRDRQDVRKITALLSHYSYLYDALTPRENLKVVADHLGFGHDQIGPLLERVLLAHRADDPVSTFSAGMRKRLSFARILLQKPRLVLLDEPYGALDPPGFDLVDDVVRELRSSGVTVMVATHQIERSASQADLGMFLNSGRLAWFGPASEAVANEAKAIGTEASR